LKEYVMRDQSDLPTALDMLESVLLLITGAVLAGPMLPGLLLCVPGLIFVAAVVLVPLVAVAALVAFAGAILAMPDLLVRSIRSRRAAAAPASVASPSLG
jgi:hypothetical protein